MKIESPRAQTVEALAPYLLRIRWNTGETLEVDLSQRLRSTPALAHVLDPVVFAKAHADPWGTAIEWEDSELGADNVYAWSREQQGEASHEMFLAWMQRNHFTLDAAADALGLSRRIIAYYKSGAKPIPKHVWLACIGWEHLREAA